MIPYIILGLATGSVYSIAALGLVITYTTSGIFNFGHGAVAAVGAFVFYALRTQTGLPWPLAAVIAVVSVALAGGVLMERLAVVLQRVDLTLRVVATVGLFVMIQAAAVLLYGGSPRYVSQYLPTHSFAVFGARISVGQIILFVLAFVAAVGLELFFRRTRLGTAMRGVVENAPLVELYAIRPGRVQTYAWIIGAGVAALSGVLLVPTLGLDATLLTLLVVQAFGAAAVGAFSSLPLTYVGGLVVGVVAAMATKLVATVPSLSQLPAGIPFLILFCILLVVPKRKLADFTAGESRELLRRRNAIPTNWRYAGMAVGVGLLLTVPVIAGSRQLEWINAMALAVVFFSLNLLVRTSGQLSLSHAAFAAVGASTFAHLSHGVGLPWLLAVLIAGLVTVPIGVVLAVPAIRLSGVYLAVATFGFGILVAQTGYFTFLMFGSGGTLAASRPSGFESDRNYYYLVLAFAFAAWALTAIIWRIRLGRLLRALAGSPTALEANGTSVNLTRVLVFAISALMAGVS